MTELDTWTQLERFRELYLKEHIKTCAAEARAKRAEAEIEALRAALRVREQMFEQLRDWLKAGASIQATDTEKPTLK